MNVSMPVLILRKNQEECFIFQNVEYCNHPASQQWVQRMGFFVHEPFETVPPAYSRNGISVG